MKLKIGLFFTLVFFLCNRSFSLHVISQQPDTMFVQAKTQNGTIEGYDKMGVKVFQGVPFAEPPVGEFRWREPQPLKNWSSVKKTHRFGPKAMQLPLFDDMRFRSNGMSEDCLYLNIWTPAKSWDEKLPVLVYFYGGGFRAGDGSEYRYDGEALARQGIVAITINYRLGIFGFFNHPELTKESPHKASGNYGLLDQSAALYWVRKNISNFGGNPDKITIAGESAGSYSVSAQMASPLSRNLMAGAIGESGSLLDFKEIKQLSEAERMGVEFSAKIGAKNLKELRDIPAKELLEISKRNDIPRFTVSVDGYFFPEKPIDIFSENKQAQIPLLVGWNSLEANYRVILGNQKVTIENFEKAIKEKYPDHAKDLLTIYKARNEHEVARIASDLAGDFFISYGAWNWSDIHANKSAQPVYRYYFMRQRPPLKGQKGKNDLVSGASHAVEIEYLLGNLSTNSVYEWKPEDYQIATLSQKFIANFIKTGNPNGYGVPLWKAVKVNQPADVMVIDVNTRMEKETHRERYLYLRSIYSK